MIVHIAGIDEAGRGCLAGPVVAAAVILDSTHPVNGLTDSKLLSPQQREKLALQIRQHALAWSVGVSWQNKIDRINILAATLEAMAKAAGTLKKQPGVLLIDGNQTIPESTLKKFWKSIEATPSQKCIVSGDRLHPAISAASIIAKTFRDQLMLAFSHKWPQYHFEKHKGYGTRQHYALLRQYGPCPLHRLTFRGVVIPAQPRLPVHEN